MRTIEGPKAPALHEKAVAEALSDDYARRVLSVCIRRARSVKQIEADTELPQATVYRHVAHLIGEGLLVVERSAMTEDGKRYELYRSRLQKARIEVDSAGVRIAWEPFEETEERLARIWNSLRGI